MGFINQLEVKHVDWKCYNIEAIAVKNQGFSQCLITKGYIQSWLIGGWPTPLKNMSQIGSSSQLGRGFNKIPWVQSTNQIIFPLIFFQGGRATTNLDNKNQGTGWCFVGFPAIFSTRPGQRLQKTMEISTMLSMGKSTMLFTGIYYQWVNPILWIYPLVNVYKQLWKITIFNG